MATTSILKKRKFEEMKTDIGRIGDIDLSINENGGVRSSLDASNRLCVPRCSPTRFVNLCTKLKKEFWKAISEMGFSSLSGMSSCGLFRPLVGWLIENFDVEDASLCVHGKRFVLTPSSFEMVMGVKDGGNDFEQVGHPDDVKRRQDAARDGKAMLLLIRLEKYLVKAESVDDLFVTRFVLFTVGTLLVPTASVCVRTSLVGSITALESVRKKNWATKSFTYLVDAIRDFKQKKGGFVGGCVLFLQVFYMHHLEGHNLYVDRSIPPIVAWMEKKSKHVVTWINEGSCYGSKNIQMRETDDGRYKCQSMHSDIKNCKLEIQELKQLVIGLQQSHREDMKKISEIVTDLMQSLKSNREVFLSGKSDNGMTV
ncbi:hypothetical protein TIFTF001_036573 [Ficus carica]|uniref:Uncharacterized protein n=1 Tax=Ficus carica TaxID=3494 RepID=A0AA88E3N3_FICCA|nr:hypothetical protein TIFTF001_036573 [Ficus carica]